MLNIELSQIYQAEKCKWWKYYTSFFLPQGKKNYSIKFAEEKNASNVNTLLGFLLQKTECEEID